MRPDKLRFDFTHGARLSHEDIEAISDRVNGWISASSPVRAIEMARDEAEKLGAMALFGEKYGDWVRVVEVEGVSRELCGGTHVANTAEVGVFAIVSEGSSASNVRRIEAITGPAASEHFRARSAALDEVGELLSAHGEEVAAAGRLRERLRELESAATRERDAAVGDLAAELASGAADVSGVAVAVGSLGELADTKGLVGQAHTIRQKLGDSAAVIVGASSGEKVGLVAVLSPAAVDRGLSASDLVREAAVVVGGGGGGRPEVAQAGGSDPEKLDEALATARAAIEAALA